MTLTQPWRLYTRRSVHHAWVIGPRFWHLNDAIRYGDMIIGARSLYKVRAS